MSDEGPALSSDGRLARGIRAREAIAEALIALLEEGADRPTAKQVAERAGVSLRLVFHHFEDTEAVLQAAVQIQIQRHWRNVNSFSTEGTLAERVRSTVRMRGALYDGIGPVRRAAALVAGRSNVIAEQLELGRSLLRTQLKDTFARELSSRASKSPATTFRERLDALETCASFETWDYLRVRLGRSPAASRSVIESMMLGVFDLPGSAIGPKRAKSRSTEKVVTRAPTPRRTSGAKKTAAAKDVVTTRSRRSTRSVRPGSSGRS